MKVLVDTIVVSEFGRAVPRPNQVRYYYVVSGRPDLVLVTWEMTLTEWRGREAILLVDTETVTGSIICQQFPKAPARWRTCGPGEVSGATIRPLQGWKRPPPGPPKPLSQALAEIFGDVE